MKICPNCGAGFDDMHKFCSNCGTLLTAAPEEKPAETETPAEAPVPAEEAAPVKEAAPAEEPAPAVETAVEPAAVHDTATTSYVVQEGDDMTSVSISWGVSSAQIRELNNLGDNDQLKPGQVIKLPADAQQ